MKRYELSIPPVKNNDLQKEVQARLDNLTKPPGSLGRLEEFVKQYCLCRGDADASITRKSLFVFAGDHGITDEGVTPYPKEVTVQMVRTMLAGGAAVSVMCEKTQTDYRVVDMGVAWPIAGNGLLIQRKIDMGTRSFLRDCAMTGQQCDRAMESGMSIADSGTSDICAVGEMGIGNTSSASALFALLLDKDGASTVGRGAGATEGLLEKKRSVIAEAVRFHRPQWDKSPMDALRRVGGFEIAGMTGFILRCAHKRLPIVIDGFIATASALCAIRMQPAIKEYLFFGHMSDEQFHRSVLQELRVRPILELDMRLGEGTGGVLAMQIIETALHCYHAMATFDSAGVSNRDP